MVRYHEIIKEDNEAGTDPETARIVEIINHYYEEHWFNQYNEKSVQEVDYDIDVDYSVTIKANCSLIRKTQILPEINIKECLYDFDCSSSTLISLQNAPKTIKGQFFCTENHLFSLEHGPEFVGSNYGCFSNNLETLQGAPAVINGDFMINSNYLESLKYCPKVIKGELVARMNPLKTLEGIDFDSEIEGPIALTYRRDLPLLRTLIVKKGVLLGNTDVQLIMNKYRGKSNIKKAIMDCQYELIKAGFKGNAKW